MAVVKVRSLQSLSNEYGIGADGFIKTNSLGCEWLSVDMMSFLGHNHTFVYIGGNDVRIDNPFRNHGEERFRSVDYIMLHRRFLVKDKLGSIIFEEELDG